MVIVRSCLLSDRPPKCRPLSPQYNYNSSTADKRCEAESSSLDVELGAPPVTTLGVVLSKKIAEHVRGFKGTLIARTNAPGFWCPTSDGTTGEWGCRTSQYSWSSSIDR